MEIDIISSKYMRTSFRRKIGDVYAILLNIYQMKDIGTESYKIYDYGNIRPATKEECAGLEECAAWAYIHLVKRLMGGEDWKDVEQFEKTVHITLPEKYKEFIMRYGGGYFGYANIYSLDVDSDFYLLKHNNLPFGKYVRIADNGCGDYYLFYIENGKSLEPLFFL